MIQLKRLIFALVLIFAGQIVYAQDIIVKKTGETISVYNIDVADKWVYYTLDVSQDGELKRIARDDVFSVKIGEGEMQLLNALHSTNASSNKDESSNHEIENSDPYLKVSPTASNNDDLISLYNKSSITGFKKMKPNDNSVDRVFAVIKVGKESILSNEDLEVSFEMIIDDRYVDWITGYHLFIKNKTNRVVYVDLGNTFRIMNNGASKIYFDGSQVTETIGSAKGVSVNMGAVAASVGLGGALGTLANGVNVGGGTQKSSSQTFGNQRILAIPPMGKVALPPIFRPTKKEVVEEYDSFKMHLPEHEFYFTKCQICNYIEENSPWKNQFIITYSHESDFSAYSNLTFTLYLNQFIGVTNTTFASSIHFFDEIVGYERNMIVAHARVSKHVQVIKEVKYIDSDGVVPEVIYF